MRKVLQAGVAAFVLGAAGSAWAEVKDSAAGGFTVENSQVVAVDPQTAWNALVDDVGRWWPADHTWWGDAGKLAVQPRAGGCFCEVDGERQAWHMTVAYVDPGVLLRMTGALGPLQGMGLGGALEWRLAKVEAGTKITLWSRFGGYTPDDLGKLAPVVDRVQGQQLGGLVEYLRKKAGRGAPPAGQAVGPSR